MFSYTYLFVSSRRRVITCFRKADKNTKATKTKPSPLDFKTFITPYKWCSDATLLYIHTVLCLLSRRSLLVMVIAVTSYETREVFRTVVNGKRFEQEEVTQIYVIEPLSACKPETFLSDKTERAGTGMMKITVAVTVGWCAWLWWAFN